MTHTALAGGFYRPIMKDPFWLCYADGRVKPFATHERAMQELDALTEIICCSPMIAALTTVPH